MPSQPTSPFSFSDDQLTSVLKSLSRTVSTSNSLPTGDQFRFLLLLSRDLRRNSATLKARLCASAAQLSRAYTPTATIAASDTDASSSSSLDSLQPSDAFFDSVVDASDEALHHFNVALDAARGISDAQIAPSGAIAPSDFVSRRGKLASNSHLTCLNIPKPQLNFPDFPIDNSHSPFVPPHFVPQPSSQPKQSQVHSYLQDLYKSNSVNTPSRHPFEDHIASAVRNMSAVSQPTIHIVQFKPPDKVPFTFVSTPAQLTNAADRLRSSSEIAIDLENHSVRSFQGFICLIQISTRDEDFVIDALSLRGNIHAALSPILCDPAIIKVFHGADKDIQWLERDFGIYVVNMFDTGQASRVLKFPSAALSYLLSRFCSLNTSKKSQYQRADWRMRPLPDDMMAYARDDTHYLLYIYDHLRTLLAKENLLGQVWERSGLVCRKRHEKPAYSDDIAKRLAARHGLRFDEHQIRLLEALCKWRDVTAREEDESLLYVSSMPVLYGIVRAREKARTLEGLMEFGFPGGDVPPIIQNHASHLVQLICDALDAKLDSPKDNERPHGKSGQDADADKAVKKTVEPENHAITREASQHIPLQAKSKSSFFMSDDEDDLEASVVDRKKCHGGHDLVAQVHAELASYLSGLAEKSHFLQDEDTESRDVTLGTKEQRKEEKAEGEVKAMRPSGYLSKTKKKRRLDASESDDPKLEITLKEEVKVEGQVNSDIKAESEVKDEQKLEPVIEPFDYKSAMAHDVKTEPTRAQPFDPLQKLCKERRQVKKRRRGNGARSRSMTFRN